MAQAQAQKSLSSADVLARNIVRGLYEGQFTAGQRLVEPDLMERFGVSRSTVREALQKLTAQGLVETHLNRGARIRELSLKQAVNIVLILEQLLALAARQAAENIQAPGARSQLEAALSPFGTQAPPQDKFEFARMRNRFNRTLARIGGNDELAALLSNINAHMIGHRMGIAAEDKRQAYCRIGAAVLEGNADLAEERVRAHLRGYLDLLAAQYPVR
jgi:DNA-binding GntR family transcriptional regulator